MLPRITSNYKPLLRALYLVLIAALWAMSRNACAQIYVANHPKDSTGVVSEYDQRGGLINANLITGLSSPDALAVEGDMLFVLDGALGTVGKYDANTGGVINAGFITMLLSPIGLAVSGNILFVSDTSKEPSEDGAVAEYDATTGEILNANIFKGVRDSSFPTGMAVDFSGTTLFVACSEYIAQYSIRTGKGSSGLYFGVGRTRGLAFAGDRFFETDTDHGGVYSIPRPDGIPSLVMAGLNRPTCLALLGSILYVVDSGSGKVATHGVSGLGENRDFITGLHAPSGIAARYPKTAQRTFTRNNSPSSIH
jgi:DNA-binding beta-propeller fold protein YncE